VAAELPHPSMALRPSLPRSRQQAEATPQGAPAGRTLLAWPEQSWRCGAQRAVHDGHAWRRPAPPGPAASASPAQHRASDRRPVAGCCPMGLAPVPLGSDEQPQVQLTRRARQARRPAARVAAAAAMRGTPRAPPMPQAARLRPARPRPRHALLPIPFAAGPAATGRERGTEGLNQAELARVARPARALLHRFACTQAAVRWKVSGHVGPGPGPGPGLGWRRLALRQRAGAWRPQPQAPIFTHVLGQARTSTSCSAPDPARCEHAGAPYAACSKRAGVGLPGYRKSPPGTPPHCLCAELAPLGAAARPPSLGKVPAPPRHAAVRQ
jgi:hypothetical protein